MVPAPLCSDRPEQAIAKAYSLELKERSKDLSPTLYTSVVNDARAEVSRVLVSVPCVEAPRSGRLVNRHIEAIAPSLAGVRCDSPEDLLPPL